MSNSLRRGQELQLKLTALDKAELKHQCSFSIDTIDGLLGLCLSIGFPGDQSKELASDIGDFCLAMLAINDHVIAPNIVAEPGSKRFHFENLRSIWLKGPLVTTQSDYTERIHRLIQITNRTKILEINPRVNDYFIRKFGVELNDFYSLIPALDTAGFSKKKNELPILNCRPLDTYAHQVINRALLEMSLSPEEYSNRVSTINNNYGDTFLVQLDLLRLFISKPFILLEEGVYLLLGLHFLLRNAELSLNSVVIDCKEDQREVQDLRGILGNSAENYAQDLIGKIVEQFKDSSDEIFYTEADQFCGAKKSKRPEIADAIILHPQLCVIFEIKYRQPPLKGHFEPTDDALENFIKWFEKHYLLSKDEARVTDSEARSGALHQLVRDANRILSGEMSGFKPSYVLPVIVNPVDLIFSVDFYEMMDREIDNKNILQGNTNIIKPIVLSLGDLEYIYGHDLKEKKISFRNILKSKALDPAGRKSTWPLVLKKLGLQYTFPKEFDDTYYSLAQKAVQVLKLQKD